MSTHPKGCAAEMMIATATELNDVLQPQPPIQVVFESKASGAVRKLFLSGFITRV